jgi:hypothetical protein
MQGITPVEPKGAVAKPSAGAIASDAVQTPVSAKRARKTPDINAFLDIYSVTAA